MTQEHNRKKVEKLIPTHDPLNRAVSKHHTHTHTQVSEAEQPAPRSRPAETYTQVSLLDACSILTQPSIQFSYTFFFFF